MDAGQAIKVTGGDNEFDDEDDDEHEDERLNNNEKLA